MTMCNILYCVTVDICKGDSGHNLSWEFEAKAARRIAIPLKKFNIEEKGSGEVRACEVDRSLFPLILHWVPLQLSFQYSCSY